MSEPIPKADIVAMDNTGYVKFAHKAGSSVLYMYDVDNNSWSESEKDKAYFCDPMGFTEEGGTGGGGTQPVVKPFSGIHIQIGAYTNRLESAARVNANTSENTQAAESRIRDTDMATMMVAFSKYSILQQAGEAMLAQANQSKQGVLDLLKE